MLVSSAQWTKGGLMLSRRQALYLAGASPVLAGLAACGPNMPNRTSGDPNSLRFTWWGEAVREELTREAIDAYKTINPDLTIAAETGDWDGYWDKLATQTAGGDTPDIIQMDEKYLMEYGGRGVLLDLQGHGLDTSAFDDAVIATGEVPDEGLLAICAGINTPVLLANPDVFEAAGVDLPDDTTWTWDDLLDIAVTISESTDDGVFGVNQLALAQPMFQAYMRQLGKDQWSTEGVGFSPDDAAQFFELGMTLQSAGATPSVSASVEESGQGLDQSLFATGQAGIAQCLSNQVVAFDASLDGKSIILRPPSLTGDASDAGLWYKSGQYFSVSARSRNPEAAVAFVDWLVNSDEAGEIVLAERGTPGNLNVRDTISEKLNESDRKSVEFIDAIEGEIKNPPVISPQGGAEFDDIFARAVEDMLFGRTDSATAGETLVNEVSGAIQT